MLHHVSERAGIKRFDARPGRDDGHVVWAVDEAHLPNYLLPRDCPRVCWHDAPTVSEIDRRTHLPGATHVVAIAAGWRARAEATPLHVYAFDDAPFRCVDAVAGYHTATAPQTPRGCVTVASGLAALERRGVELRVLASDDELRLLATRIAASTLAFSCIRLRNLQSSPAA